MYNLLFLSLSLVLLLNFSDVEAAPQGSLITSLPGFTGTFPSRHYSGYVSIEGEGGEAPKNLFYYLVESERNPSKDPLVLWLNGGPGCSSFDGFIYEHGPFNFEAGKAVGSLPVLHLNQYSWSKVSSVIYLESPAGVGFSYSENTTTYVNGDIQTAIDTNIFLLKWLEQFPEFLANPFYIAGESYAGVYVPTLASNIVKGTQTGVKPIINLKGYMVGNGVTDRKFDGNALVPFAHGMGLISNDMFEEAQTTCKGNYDDPPNDQNCIFILNKIDTVLDGLNIYDILEPCYHSPTSTTKENTSLKKQFGHSWPFRAPVRDGIVPSWPQLDAKLSVPCINDEVATTWLNDDTVRKAIHANPGSGEWSLCSDKLSYSHDAGSMINYHKNLTAQGYRALIFSGDHDMRVPFTGSQAWTRSLGYEIVDEWRSWLSNQQIAGYTQGYAKNLTFLTIKGAGHTVPQYKPRESLDFYSRWIEGTPI